jgi:DNA-binding Lrp family transcriptional regulator
MVKAFVLINAKPGAEANLVGNLKELEEVEDAWAVYGEYDVIALANVGDLKDLDSFVTERIRRLGEVQFTSTMICIR